MDYITVEQLAQSLGQGIQDSPLNGDLRSDAETVITSASEQIDEYCGRRFTPPVSGVRRLSPDNTSSFRLPKFTDLLTVAAVSVDSNGDGIIETPWDVSDLILEPFNLGEDSPRPFTIVSTLSKRFPLTRGGLEITGTWGWGDTVPSRVISATLLRAAALWSRRNSSDGVVASAGGDVYRISRFTDPDICSLLDGGDLVRSTPQIASLQIGSR